MSEASRPAPPIQDITAPEDIEAASLAIIDTEVPEPRPFAGNEWVVARRMIHTTADFDLLAHIRFHPEAVSAGLAALADGAVVATDTQMARVGIPLRRMEPLGCSVACLMNDGEVAARAKASGRTRAFEAVDEMQRRHAPAVWAIGNAPTALLRLLELIGEGRAAPKLIVGMPVGFVNAAESKDLLAAQDAVPYITILGRKGGSALAACAVNALAGMALEKN